MSVIVVGRAEAWAADDARKLIVVERFDRRVHESLGARAREHLLAIDAAPVILHAHCDHLPLAGDRERELAGARFPVALAHIGLLDAVVGGVAQQMHDRLADLVEHRTVELDLAPVEGELDLLSQRVRGIADEARKAIEHLADGHHAARHDLVVEIGDEPRCLRERVIERGIRELVRDVGEPAARDEKLASEIRQPVEATELDADRAWCSPRGICGGFGGCGCASRCWRGGHGCPGGRACARECVEAREGRRRRRLRRSSRHLDLHRAFERIHRGEERVRHYAVDHELGWRTRSSSDSSSCASAVTAA